MVIYNMKKIKTRDFLNSSPANVKQILLTLGRNIRIARLRRNMRLVDLAERVGISRFTMSDVEKGKPSTGIGAYITALWVLGLSAELKNIADPDQDTEGKKLDGIRFRKTATKRKKVLDNDF